MPQTSNPWLILIGLLFTGLSSIGIKEMVQSMLKRRPKKAVEVSNQIQLAAAIQRYAEKVEKDAEQYRASAAKAWAAVDEANQKLMRVTSKLDDSTWKFEQAARYLDSVIAKAFESGVSIEEFREYIKNRPVPFTRHND